VNHGLKGKIDKRGDPRERLSKQQTQAQESPRWK
jgi:hypothetical protein